MSSNRPDEIKNIKKMMEDKISQIYNRRRTLDKEQPPNLQNIPASSPLSSAKSSSPKEEHFPSKIDSPQKEPTKPPRRPNVPPLTRNEGQSISRDSLPIPSTTLLPSSSSPTLPSLTSTSSLVSSSSPQNSPLPSPKKKKNNDPKSLSTQSKIDFLINRFFTVDEIDQLNVLLAHSIYLESKDLLEEVIKKYPNLDETPNSPHISITWAEKIDIPQDKQNFFLQEIQNLREENRVLRIRLKAQKTMKVRSRLALLLSRWLKELFSDFDESMIRAVNLFIEFQNRIPTEPDDKAAVLLDKCRYYLENPENAQYDNDDSSSSSMPFSPTTTRLLDLDSKRYAQQHTRVEANLMYAMNTREFLKQKWNKGEKNILAPNIVASINFFNKRSGYYCIEIVKGETPKQRAETIEKIIDIGMKLHRLNNFNGLMEILSCLTNSSIGRLQKSWQLVSPNSKESLEILSSLMSPTSNYGTYRTVVKNCPPPFLPFLGVTLTDFTFIDEGNPDFNSDGTINFEKIDLIGANFREIIRMKSQKYEIEEDGRYYRLLHNSEDWSEQEIFQLSQLREKRQNQNDLDGEDQISPSLAKSVTPTREQKQPSKNSLERVGGGGGTVNGGVNPMAQTAPSGSVDGPQVLTAGSNFQSENWVLTKRNWKLLLTGSTKTNYTKGQVIIKEGDPCLTFYRLENGQVRAEKSSRPHLVQIFHAPDMFGEISIITQKASATFIAETSVVVYAIDLGFVFSVLNARADICKRFFIQLAFLLASRLLSLPTSPDQNINSPQQRAVLSTATGSESETKKRDEWFRKKFHLPSKEVLVKEFSCALKRDNKPLHCNLYVSFNYVCFRTHVFGYKTKGSVPFKQVANVFTDSTKHELTLSVITKEKEKEKEKEEKKERDREREKEPEKEKVPSSPQVSNNTGGGSNINNSSSRKKFYFRSRPTTNTNTPPTTHVNTASSTNTNAITNNTNTTPTSTHSGLDQSLGVGTANILASTSTPSLPTSKSNPNTMMLGQSPISLSAINDRQFIFTSSKRCQRAFTLLDQLWKKASDLPSASPLPSLADVVSPATPTSKQALKRLGIDSAAVVEASNSAKSAFNFHLSRDEWDMLLRKANCFSYNRGQVVIREGTAYQRLYHIATGSCRVVKRSAFQQQQRPASDRTGLSTTLNPGPSPIWGAGWASPSASLSMSSLSASPSSPSCSLSTSPSASPDRSSSLFANSDFLDNTSSSSSSSSSSLSLSSSLMATTSNPFLNSFSEHPPKDVELGKMKAGEVFGEINYLHGGTATATVIADEDETTVYVMDGQIINLLFEKKPGLAGRFFLYIARLLARRIEAREQS